MAEITASDVAKLREMTNVGMMECKKALIEANGDINLAVEILRKKGIASAAKKAGREAREGVIAQYIAPGAKIGVLVEVNCETDFVARNEVFKAFAELVAKKLAENPNADYETEKLDTFNRLRENIKVSRFTRYEVEGNGLVAAYIHTGSKVGVLVEVGAGKEETVRNDKFKSLVKDITLQIAAANPFVVSRENVPADVLAKEREIAAEQVKNKPQQVIEKIVAGKLEKFYQSYCLLDQGFVRQNGEITVKDYINGIAKELGDTITVKRFVRFQVGESFAS
ncbi:MAG: translation elongation factor Ts [Limisphaerales bacterium]|jgi:elongation factor Ts